MVSKQLSSLKLSLQERKQPTSYPPSHISVGTHNPLKSHSSLSSLAPIRGPAMRYCTAIRHEVSEWSLRETVMKFTKLSATQLTFHDFLNKQIYIFR